MYLCKSNIFYPHLIPIIIHTSHMNKPLTVYKASAGSGKTFTLAVEYIKLLVRNPQSYRSILAVTFTNKATEEMKTRILSQLYGIWHRLPDSQTYADRICADLGMDPATVSRRAGTALRLLIHNYGYFRIETIDSFFQTVLRNLARELDLTANLRIELNDSQVEEHAVDKLIEELDTKNETLRLIIEYINDKIADDKSWNVIGQIKAFGKTIFRDFYKEESREMSEKTSDGRFMKQYADRLRNEMNAAQERMEQIADSFFDVLTSEGLTVDDLSYRSSGVAGLFIKMKNGTFDESIVGKRVTDCLDDVRKWYSAKSPHRETIHALALGPLTDLLHTAIEERPRQWRRYKSAELTLRHLYQLRLLGSIENKVREMNEEANRFLLSDTQQLLHSLISGSDSPFIFEKIGTQLEHVMIDEFQDTSSVQWRNFKVLLMECMSREEASNLIVGDVKQSIYRWRSGDWRLLNDIRGQFDGNDRLLGVKALTTNYRSAGNVISFNNTFFAQAVEMECAAIDADGQSESHASQLRSAYADVAQQVPQSREGTGYVNIRLLTGDDYERAVLDSLADTVSQLLMCGADAGSIAILVRTNKHIPLIAKHLTERLPDVRIVSDEAFRLDASLAVCTLIQALRLLTHRNDALTRVSLIKTYQLHIMGKSLTEQNMALVNDTATLLPEAYTAHMDELAAMPLYDLAERLYAIFHLERLGGQSAYVCAFYDQLSSFTQDHIADIDTFVAEWERTICNKTIQSDEPDGIRLISIHKSKGLEFDSVIIPFCDWQLEKTSGNVLWCKPQEMPFDDLPIIPVDYSRKGMAGTIYEPHYKDEFLQNSVDNLNLLYVAFTRAGRNLFVIGRRDARNSRSQLIQACLPDIATQLGTTLTGMDDGSGNDETVTFEYGTIVTGATGKQSDTTSANVFVQPVEPMPISIETFDNKTEFMQSNQSRDFIAGEDEGETDERHEYIRTGSVLHNVFSEIRTAADVDGAMQRLESEGMLDRTSVDKITVMLHKRLSTPQVADWFSDRWQLFNECSILYADAEGNVTERRPDRVMTDGNRMIVVDFKFGRPRDEYMEQVREYMQLLEAMGHRHVEGFLWFVYSNKVEQVFG